MFKKNATIFVSMMCAVLGLSACAISSPPYAISVENVQTLKSADVGGAAVDQFSAGGAGANNDAIGLRGTSLTAGQGGYAAYLQKAITLELIEAGLLDKQSDVHIAATLIKNDIHAAGIRTADAEIAARFVVSKSGKVIFDKVKEAAIEWDSSFAGPVAIARAQNKYPELVAALLKTLYADEAFLTALRK